MTQSPIVLFVYNRPDHTRHTLEALSEATLADESILYIYADGPAENASASHQALIEEVRTLIRQKQWCKEVHIVEAEMNKGLADSIVSGVTEVVNRHGRVIVLEDDLVVSNGFLSYCNEALDLYQDDPNVMHVAGSVYDADYSHEQDTFFLKVMQCHGWATWKRAWDQYDHDALDHLAWFHSDPQRASAFDIEGNAYFMKQLVLNVSGELKSWAVRWYASWLRAGGVALFPEKSLVRNIGFDGSGVNCGGEKGYLAPVVQTIAVNRVPIQEDLAIRDAMGQFWHRYLNGPAPKGRLGIRRRIARWMDPFWKLGGRIDRRPLVKLFPDLKPLLLAQGRLAWHHVVTSIKDSCIDASVKLCDPIHSRYCRIGAHSYLGHSAFISYTEIGKFCSIGPGFQCGWGIHPTDGLSTSPTFYSSNPANGYRLCENSKVIERKKITIGNDVFIGMNVTVLDGVTIGDGAVIGAGCVVSKDVPPYAIAVGCPLNILRYRFEEGAREKLLSIRWWDWPEEKLKEVERNFFEIETFIQNHG